MIKYLIVHDMNEVISSVNCDILGIPEKTTFDGLRKITESLKDRGSGYVKSKEGKYIWIAPYKDSGNLILNPNEDIYEVLTEEELNNFNFDEIK
tara:strand:+ start:3309 stop:3590 length:282 start_codon:yes stop_codon:yes gene_type:complete